MFDLCGVQFVPGTLLEKLRTQVLVVKAKSVYYFCAKRYLKFLSLIYTYTMYTGIAYKIVGIVVALIENLENLQKHKKTTTLFAFENEASLMSSTPASLQLNSTTERMPWELYQLGTLLHEFAALQ